LLVAHQAGVQRTRLHDPARTGVTDLSWACGRIGAGPTVTETSRLRPRQRHRRLRELKAELLGDVLTPGVGTPDAISG
jgi:hypothetical protein